jgi:hypothetical protein
MRNKYPYIITVLLFILVGLTVLVTKFTAMSSTIFLALSGWTTFALKHLYNKWEWFYLKIQKMRCIIYNPDTLWNMTVRYKVKLNKDKLIKLQNVILSGKIAKDPKFIQLTSGDWELRSGGMILQLFVQEDELEIHLIDLPTTYNKSLNLLENELVPLLESIETAIHAESKTYFLKVSFDGINPYFGLYVNKLPRNAVMDFDVKFVVNDNKVEVSKKSITIKTNEKSKLSNISREYLTLSAR